MVIEWFDSLAFGIYCNDTSRCPFCVVFNDLKVCALQMFSSKRENKRCMKALFVVTSVLWIISLSFFVSSFPFQVYFYESQVQDWRTTKRGVELFCRWQQQWDEWVQIIDSMWEHKRRHTDFLDSSLNCVWVSLCVEHTWRQEKDHRCKITIVVHFAVAIFAQLHASYNARQSWISSYHGYSSYARLHTDDVLRVHWSLFDNITLLF